MNENNKYIEMFKDNESLFSISESKLISELLNPFSKKELNKYFDRMASDLKDFISFKENNKKININESNEMKFKNILYSLLGKNLIEIIYIINKSYREEKIRKIFHWYKEQLKTFEDIRYINKKTYKDVDSFDDEEYFKKKIEKMIKDNEYLTEDDILKEQKTHRTQDTFDKKMLNDYKRVNIYNNPYYKKLNNKNKFIQSKISEESTKTLKSPIFKKKISQQAIILNHPITDYSNFYSNVSGKNSFSLKKIYISKNIQKPEGGKKDIVYPDLNKEIKSSYSFNRPEYDYSILKTEKIVNERKNKLIKEKRAEEEIGKNLDKFGKARAYFKENIFKKYELKNIINMYAKIKKYNYKFIHSIHSNTSLLKGTIKQELDDKRNSKINEFIPIKLIPRLTSRKEIIPKSCQLENNDNTPKYNRMLKRHNTSVDMKISKKFRSMGKKLILDEIKNINKETNEIRDNLSDKIHVFNIKLKYPKYLIKNKLIKSKINNEYNNNRTPNDIIYKLLSEEPLFRQKMISDTICNITVKMNDKKFIKDPLEEESIYHNFCLSAYNWKNMKIIEKAKKNLDKGVKILRHISPLSNNIGNKRSLSENDTFNNYRNDYLNLRKTIGEWKKYEYKQLLKKMSKNNTKEKCEESPNMNKEKSYKNKDAFLYRINTYQKNLMNSILNPNEDNSFPSYFLPKSGSTLLSKIEINTQKNKKNRK